MVKYDTSESPASLSLCRTCNNRFFSPNSFQFWAEAEAKDKWYGDTKETHHASEEGIRDAVSQNCWLCRQLPRDRGGDMRFGAFKDGTTYRMTKVDPEIHSGRTSSMRYLVLIEGSGTREYNEKRGDAEPLNHGDYRVDAIEPWGEVHDLAVKARATATTGSGPTLELAKLWLKTCDEEHACGQPAKVGWYPTRLLDVSKDRIRLIHSAKEKDLKDPYASLSHCWGTEYFLRLTSANVEEFEAGVPFSEFPLTFQHAITTVRALGISYIWIDCYCIIQGADQVAQEDWAREVDKMREVYSHSFVNIGAATTDNPQGGLFRDRELHRNRTCFVKWRPTDEDEERIWRFREHSNWNSAHCFGAFQGLQRKTLMRRAWVIQEAALSNRMLTFTDEGLMWQCNWTAACEDFPLQMADCLDWSTALPFWTMSDTAALAQDLKTAETLQKVPGWSSVATKEDWQQSKFSTLIERWYRLLDAYRLARLTFPEKDTFPAIDGIARLLSSKMSDRYQHGVFSRSIVPGLLWEAKEERCRRTDIPGIPNWHWASYDGPVEFWSCEYLHLQARESRKHYAPFAYFFMSDDCTALAGDDAHDFWPELLCIGKPLAIDKDSSRKVFATVEYPSFPSNFFPALAVTGSKLSLDIDKDEWQQNLDAQYAFLPLVGTHDATKMRHDEDEVVNLHVQGLVLRDTGPGRYKRVGTGTAATHGQDAMLALFNKLKPELIILE